MSDMSITAIYHGMSLTVLYDGMTPNVMLLDASVSTNNAQHISADDYNNSVFRENIVLKT